MTETRTIKTDLLARVEGEGAMFLRIRDGRVDDVRLRIYEPPRPRRNASKKRGGS